MGEPEGAGAGAPDREGVSEPLGVAVCEGAGAVVCEGPQTEGCGIDQASHEGKYEATIVALSGTTTTRPPRAEQPQSTPLFVPAT